MNKSLLTVLKVVLVGALMYWVFTTVPWRDSYLTDPGTPQQTATFGEILGPWDQSSVSFRPEGSEGVLELDQLLVVPGFWTYWANLHWSWFVGGLGLYLLSLAFSATRWWWLLRANNLPIGCFAALKFTFIGLFFNNVVPGQTGGDLVKAIYVMKRCPGERVAALMSVVVDRIMGLASLSILAAVAVLFYLDDSEFRYLAVVLWAILGVVVLMGVLAFSRRMRSMIKLSDLLGALPKRISDLLRRVDDAVYFYRSHKVGMTVWLLAGVFNHVSSVLSYFCVGEALGVGMPIEDYFVLIPIIVIVSAIPIAPNGWGVGEFMFQQLFGKFGAVHLPAVEGAQIMGTRGAALSVVYRLFILTTVSLAGGILFFFDKDKVTRADMKREIAAEEEEAASDASRAAGRANNGIDE